MVLCADKEEKGEGRKKNKKKEKKSGFSKLVLADSLWEQKGSKRPLPDPEGQGQP